IVLFLRPTQSLTVFLQQLGRGLRHAPEKDCLTVLDFVGQVHRRYRIDKKLKALLPKHRFAIDREVENNFPHLPAGCSIQFERIARDHVLANIRVNLKNLANQVLERLHTFSAETGQQLTFGNFVRYHDYEPERLMLAESWTGWKAKARLAPVPDDPDLTQLKKALVRAVFISGPREIALLRKIVTLLAKKEVAHALTVAGDQAMAVYYRIWSATGENAGNGSIEEAFARLSRNQTILADLEEILEWAECKITARGTMPPLPFPSSLELHAQYSIKDIQAATGRLSLATAGQTGTGVLSFPDVKTYVLLVTFQKSEKEFSPSTMYADYPISRELMHWESQTRTAQQSPTGQNLIYHRQLGVTILLFARDQKKQNNCLVPFTYLGPAERVSFENERPIKMVWKLQHQMPVNMFEENRRGG
ncbi:MAG: DUF3427 domain-containing protein, partial [Thermodesulfobacteriota bacterium]|nr:DUF3427 domain-containing protein [Thermodesulfobacteriota bacterium]